MRSGDSYRVSGNVYKTERVSPPEQFKGENPLLDKGSFSKQFFPIFGAQA